MNLLAVVLAAALIRPPPPPQPPAPPQPVAVPLGSPAGTPAADVASVIQLAAALDGLDARAGDLDVAAASGIVTRALWTSCEQTAREQGVSGLENDDWEPLRKGVAKEAKRMAEAIPVDKGAARTIGLRKLVRDLTSLKLPASLVASWLGFGASTRQGIRKPSPKVTGKEQEEEEEVEAEDVSSQIVGPVASDAEVALDPTHSRVILEAGGPGEGNRYIDNGEWAQIFFALKVKGTRPWFSSSAWVESDSGCAWSNPRDEHVVSEFDTGGWGGFTAWVYFSKQCSMGLRRLRITVKDTHRSTDGVTFTVAIKPLEVFAPQIVNGKFDTDVPGTSDGSSAVEVGPNLKFEYSLDQEVTSPLVKSVQMAYLAPKDLEALFASFEYRNVPLLKDGTTFRAGDDLDAQIVPMDGFKAALHAVRESKEWCLRSLKNRLWIAVDTRLEVDPPGALATAGAATGGGSRKCDCPDPVSGKTVVELARKHMLLRVRPAPPRLPGSVTATDGYEGAIDAEGLLAEYQALLQPEAPDEPAVPAPLAYHFRSYFALPLIAVNLARPAEPIASAPPPPPEPVPEPVREKEPVLRFDVGGGWTGYLTRRSADGTALFKEVGFVHGGEGELRLSYGRTLALTVLGTVGGGTATSDLGKLANGANAFYMLEVTADLGVAYNLVRGNAEVMPYLAGGYRFRHATYSSDYHDVFGPTDPEHGVEALVGVVLRYKLASHFGFYADLSWRFGTGGPDWHDSNALTGIGPRLSAGFAFSL